MFATGPVSLRVCSRLCYIYVCVCVYLVPPSVVAGRVADSDREAGHWVMEFVPVESASH